MPDPISVSVSVDWLLATLASRKPVPPIIPKPIPVPRPDFEVDLVRPDDLLSLHVTGYNLKPAPGNAGPVLARLDATKDAVLVVTFPPQNIAETAFYQSTGMPPLPPPPGITPPPDPPQAAVIPAPGQVEARLAGPTRLAFRIPAKAAMPVIPYTTAGLLDWSGLEPVVPALADIPAAPTPEQIANAPDVAPPGAQETAIELPYRLILSPDHTGVWRHATAPITYAGRTELWHTRLALKPDGGAIAETSPTNPASLRAVYSPDYNPARATDPAQHPIPQDLDPDLGVTDISPNDRHQLVVLTSKFHGYVDASKQPFLPLPVAAELLMLSPLGGWLRSRGHWAPPLASRWIPIPFQPLTSAAALLGGVAVPRPASALRPAIEHQPAAAVGPVNPVEVPVARPPIPPIRGGITVVGEQLDLSEWVHIAAQGRDHYVRIVYEGHLYPCGHRAALIKITERKFRDVTLPDGTHTVGAYLFQRQYIVVREPEKVYTGQLGDANANKIAGHKLPLKKIRLTTLVTPDLTLPRALIGSSNSSWVVVGPLPGADFKFHAVATDIADNTVEFTASLIFMPLGDTGGSAPKVGEIRSAYLGSGSRRSLVVPKQKMTYAPRNPADSSTDNTTLVTSALYLDTDSYAELVDSFGGYMPKLLKAEVHIPAIEQLLGTDTATTIRLYNDYVFGDLDVHAGVFAEIAKEIAPGVTAADTLPVTFTADKAGGIATPNLNLSNLTRAHGPLAGTPAKAAQNAFDAADFFGGFSDDLLPKLFGAIKLTDLLPIAGGGNPTASKNAPKTQFSTLDNADGSKTLRVAFDWAPDVRAVNIPGLPVSFTPNDNGVSALTIHGEILKPIALPPAPPPSSNSGSSSFKGELTFFRLDILNAIALHFSSFSFSSGTGKKLDVGCHLDPQKPFEFEGDLTFVQDLSNIIPPGAFGDGPSIDLTTAPGVHVGYGVTLPPAAVGVFSLENIKLSAGLDLPFLTGKPMVDFGFAERHHPFLLTVSLLGGGGFLHLQLDTEGMKLLEAAFEFGANASINLGVASGGVHIMAGIYFSMQIDNGVNKSTLSGYLRMGGELSVLGLISVSLEFMLSFSLIDGKASGRATLTVEVQVLFFSKSVEISVEKRFGGSGGDPTFAQLITSASVWNDYASKFA